MIYFVKNNTYAQIRHLFRELEAFQPLCTAVLDGIGPATGIVMKVTRTVVPGDAYAAP